MQSKKIGLIFEYAAWFLKKHNEIKQAEEKNIYRIIEIKQPSNGQAKIIVQIVGKSAVIECTPQEIVADDNLIEGFSKKDVRTVTYFACQQIKKPRYKIIMQSFCEKFNRMVFKLKESTSDNVLMKTADEIVTDKAFLKNLSREDINSISYMAGYECSQIKDISCKSENK